MFMQFNSGKVTAEVANLHLARYSACCRGHRSSYHSGSFRRLTASRAQITTQFLIENARLKFRIIPAVSAISNFLIENGSLFYSRAAEQNCFARRFAPEFHL